MNQLHAWNNIGATLANRWRTWFGLVSIVCILAFATVSNAQSAGVLWWEPVFAEDFEGSAFTNELSLNECSGWTVDSYEVNANQTLLFWRVANYGQGPLLQDKAANIHWNSSPNEEPLEYGVQIASPVVSTQNVQAVELYFDYALNLHMNGTNHNLLVYVTEDNWNSEVFVGAIESTTSIAPTTYFVDLTSFLTSTHTSFQIGFRAEGVDTVTYLNGWWLDNVVILAGSTMDNTNDDYENNDSITQAYEIQVPFNENSLVIATGDSVGDIDYFRFTTEENGTLFVGVEADRPIKIELYSEGTAGALEFLCSLFGGAEEGMASVAYGANGQRTWYVRASGATQSNSPNYSLDISFDNAQNDPFESNDTAETAYEFGSSGHVDSGSAQIGAGDIDYFRVEGVAGVSIRTMDDAAGSNLALLTLDVYVIVGENGDGTWQLIQVGTYSSLEAYQDTFMNISDSSNQDYILRFSTGTAVAPGTWLGYGFEVEEAFETDESQVVLVTPASVSSDAGYPLVLDANAVANDPNHTIRYSISGLPSGATIDAVTGIVNWTPTPIVDVGVHNATVTAVNWGSDHAFGTTDDSLDDAVVTFTINQPIDTDSTLVLMSSVSSVVVSVGGAQQIASFELTDTGTYDLIPTVLQSLQLELGSGTESSVINEFTWKLNGNSGVIATQVGGPPILRFQNISNITAPDGGVTGFDLTATPKNKVTVDGLIVSNLDGKSINLVLNSGSSTVVSSEIGGMSGPDISVYVDVQATGLFLQVQPNTFGQWIWYLHTDKALPVEVFAISDTGHVDMDASLTATLGWSGSAQLNISQIALTDGWASLEQAGVQLSRIPVELADLTASDPSASLNTGWYSCGLRNEDDEDATVSATTGSADPTTVDSVALASGMVDVFHFTIADGGNGGAASDLKNTVVTSLSLYSGDSHNAEYHTFFIDGPGAQTYVDDATAVPTKGSFGIDAAGRKFIQFTGLNISVPDGQGHQFVIKMQAGTSPVDPNLEGVWNFRIEPSLLQTFGSSTSISPSAVTLGNNGGVGLDIEVVASQLALVAPPTSPTVYTNSLLDFEVHFVDAVGNLDHDVSESVTISWNGIGVVEYPVATQQSRPGVFRFVEAGTYIDGYPQVASFTFDDEPTGPGGDLAPVSTEIYSVAALPTINSFPYEPDDIQLASDFVPNYGLSPVPSGSYFEFGETTWPRRGFNGSGDFAWAVRPDDTYDIGSVTWLHSPKLDLSALSQSQGYFGILFDVWGDMGEETASLKLQTSVDFGPWTDLACPYRPYVRMAPASLSHFGGAGIAWADNDLAALSMFAMQADLTGFLGSGNLRLRWGFESHSGVSTGLGLSIDRIRVGYMHQAPAPATLYNEYITTPVVLSQSGQIAADPFHLRTAAPILAWSLLSDWMGTQQLSYRVVVEEPNGLPVFDTGDIQSANTEHQLLLPVGVMCEVTIYVGTGLQTLQSDTVYLRVNSSPSAVDGSSGVPQGGTNVGGRQPALEWIACSDAEGDPVHYIITITTPDMTAYVIDSRYEQGIQYKDFDGTWKDYPSEGTYVSGRPVRYLSTSSMRSVGSWSWCVDALDSFTSAPVTGATWTFSTSGIYQFSGALLDQYSQPWVASGEAIKLSQAVPVQQELQPLSPVVAAPTTGQFTFATSADLIVGSSLMLRNASGSAFAIFKLGHESEMDKLDMVDGSLAIRSPSGTHDTIGVSELGFAALQPSVATWTNLPYGGPQEFLVSASGIASVRLFGALAVAANEAFVAPSQNAILEYGSHLSISGGVFDCANLQGLGCRLALEQGGTIAVRDTMFLSGTLVVTSGSKMSFVDDGSHSHSNGGSGFPYQLSGDARFEDSEIVFVREGASNGKALEVMQGNISISNSILRDLYEWGAAPPTPVPATVSTLRVNPFGSATLNLSRVGFEDVRLHIGFNAITHTLDECVFSGDLDGCFLQWEELAGNKSELSAWACRFERSDSSHVGFNVSAQALSRAVVFNSHGGDFAGAQFEEDPGYIVEWPLPPVPPSAGLVAFSMDGVVLLEWQEHSGSVEYIVRRRESGSTTSGVLTPANYTLNTFRDANVTNGVTYEYRVETLVTMPQPFSAGYSNVATATPSPAVLESVFPETIASSGTTLLTISLANTLLVDDSSANVSVSKIGGAGLTVASFQVLGYGTVAVQLHATNATTGLWTLNILTTDRSQGTPHTLTHSVDVSVVPYTNYEALPSMALANAAEDPFQHDHKLYFSVDTDGGVPIAPASILIHSSRKWKYLGVEHDSDVNIFEFFDNLGLVSWVSGFEFEIELGPDAVFFSGHNVFTLEVRNYYGIGASPRKSVFTVRSMGRGLEAKWLGVDGICSVYSNSGPGGTTQTLYDFELVLNGVAANSVTFIGHYGGDQSKDIPVHHPPFSVRTISTQSSPAIATRVVATVDLWYLLQGFLFWNKVRELKLDVHADGALEGTASLPVYAGGRRTFLSELDLCSTDSPRVGQGVNAKTGEFSYNLPLVNLSPEGNSFPVSVSMGYSSGGEVPGWSFSVGHTLIRLSAFDFGGKQWYSPIPLRLKDTPGEVTAALMYNGVPLYPAGEGHPNTFVSKSHRIQCELENDGAIVTDIASERIISFDGDGLVRIVGNLRQCTSGNLSNQGSYLYEWHPLPSEFGPRLKAVKRRPSGSQTYSETVLSTLYVNDAASGRLRLSKLYDNAYSVSYGSVRTWQFGWLTFEGSDYLEEVTLPATPQLGETSLESMKYYFRYETNTEQITIDGTNVEKKTPRYLTRIYGPTLKSVYSAPLQLANHYDAWRVYRQEIPGHGSYLSKGVDTYRYDIRYTSSTAATSGLPAWAYEGNPSAVTRVVGPSGVYEQYVLNYEGRLIGHTVFAGRFQYPPSSHNSITTAKPSLLEAPHDSIGPIARAEVFGYTNVSSVVLENTVPSEIVTEALQKSVTQVVVNASAPTQVRRESFEYPIEADSMANLLSSRSFAVVPGTVTLDSGYFYFVPSISLVEGSLSGSLLQVCWPSSDNNSVWRSIADCSDLSSASRYLAEGFLLTITEDVDTSYQGSICSKLSVRGSIPSSGPSGVSLPCYVVRAAESVALAALPRKLTTEDLVTGESRTDEYAYEPWFGQLTEVKRFSGAETRSLFMKPHQGSRVRKVVQFGPVGGGVLPGLEPVTEYEYSSGLVSKRRSGFLHTSVVSDELQRPLVALSEEVYSYVNGFVSSVELRSGSTSYGYDRMGWDSVGRLIRELKRGSSVSGANGTYQNAPGAFTEYQYDALDRTLLVTYPMTGKSPNLAQATSNLRPRDAFIYDESQLSLELSSYIPMCNSASPGSTILTGGVYSTVENNYLVSWDVTSPTWSKVKYFYDPAGRPDTVSRQLTRALWSDTRLKYDGAGRVTQNDSTNQSRTETKYDAFGNVHSVYIGNSKANNNLDRILVSYDVYGNVSKRTRKSQTLYAFDSGSRIEDVVDTYVYNGFGELLDADEAGKGRTTYSYNHATRTMDSSRFAYPLEYSTITKGYSGGSVTYRQLKESYQAVGRGKAYFAGKPSAKMIAGLCLASCDNDKYHVSRMEPYEESLKLVRVTSFRHNGTPIESFLAETPSNNLTIVDCFLGAQEPGKRQLVQYSYSGNDLLAVVESGQSIVPAGQSGSGVTWAETSTSYGNYDLYGRPHYVHSSRLDVNGNPIETEYMYDSDGNVVRETFADASFVERSYTFDGRVCREYHSTSGGNRERITEYNGSIIVERQTDSSGDSFRVTEIDDEGRVQSVLSSDGTSEQFEYYPNGLVQKSTKNSQTLVYGYDEAGRLVRTTSIGSGVGVIEERFKYGMEGNLLKAETYSAFPGRSRYLSSSIILGHNSLGACDFQWTSSQVYARVGATEHMQEKLLGDPLGPKGFEICAEYDEFRTPSRLEFDVHQNWTGEQWEVEHDLFGTVTGMGPNNAKGLRWEADYHAPGVLKSRSLFFGTNASFQFYQVAERETHAGKVGGQPNLGRIGSIKYYIDSASAQDWAYMFNRSYDNMGYATTDLAGVSGSFAVRTAQVTDKFGQVVSDYRSAVAPSLDIFSNSGSPRTVTPNSVAGIVSDRMSESSFTYNEHGHRTSMRTRGAADTLGTGVTLSVNGSTGGLNGANYGDTTRNSSINGSNQRGRIESDTSRGLNYSYNMHGQPVIESRTVGNQPLRYFHYDALGNLIGVERIGVTAEAGLNGTVHTHYYQGLYGFIMGLGYLAKYETDIGHMGGQLASLGNATAHASGGTSFYSRLNYFGPGPDGRLAVVGHHEESADKALAHIRDHDGSLRDLVSFNADGKLERHAEIDYDTFGRPYQRGIAWTCGQEGPPASAVVETISVLVGGVEQPLELVHIAHGADQLKPGAVVVVLGNEPGSSGGTMRITGRVYEKNAMRPNFGSQNTPTTIAGILILPDISVQSFLTAWNSAYLTPGAIFAYDDHIVDSVAAMGDIQEADIHVIRSSGGGSYVTTVAYYPGVAPPYGSTDEYYLRLKDEQRDFGFMAQQYRSSPSNSYTRFGKLVIEPKRATSPWQFTQFTLDWSHDGPGFGGGVQGNYIYIYLGSRSPGSSFMPYGTNCPSGWTPQDIKDLFDLSEAPRYTIGEYEKNPSQPHWTSTSNTWQEVAYQSSSNRTKLTIQQTPHHYMIPAYMKDAAIQPNLSIPVFADILEIWRDDSAGIFGVYVHGNWEGIVDPDDRFVIYADQTVWHNSNPENYRQHRKSIHELLYAGYHYTDPAVSYLQPSPGGWTLMAVSTAQSGWNLAGMYITGMRGYDPWLGRFLSPDPLSSPFWNSYHYCYNNPMTYKDPTGLASWYNPAGWLTPNSDSFTDAECWGFVSGVASDSVTNVFRQESLDSINGTCAEYVSTATFGALSAEDVGGFIGVDTSSRAFQFGKGSGQVAAAAALIVAPGATALKAGSSVGRLGAQSMRVAAASAGSSTLLGRATGAIAGSRAGQAVGRMFSRSPSAVWSLGPGPRGLAIEASLGGNLPRGFPTIDRFRNGVATSIKSIDLGASSYQKGSALLSRVNGYIDKVAGFQGAVYGGRSILPHAVSKRGLDLVIPIGRATREQSAILGRATQYAREIGVNMRIVRK